MQSYILDKQKTRAERHPDCFRTGRATGFIPYLLLACICLLFLSSCTRPYKESDPSRAVGGVLDLRERDFAKEGPVSLKGDWEFYWNSLLVSSDFSQNAKPGQYSTIRVPSTWSDERASVNPYPVYGCATYRLKVLLPHRTAPLSLRIPAVDTAYRLTVNGKELFVNGRVGCSKQSSKPLYYAPVCRQLSRASELEIVVQMSNYDFPRPGMKDCFVLGESDEILSESEARLALHIFVVGAMILMAVYHLCFFFQRPSDRSSLYFSLLCISTLSRLLVTGEAYAYHFDWITWEIGSKVEYLSLLGWVIGIMFLRTFFPKEVSLKVMIPVSAVVAVLSLIVVFTPVIFFTRLLPLFDIISVFYILYFHYALLLAFVRKREYARTLFAGWVIFAATIVNDMLLGYRLIDSVYVMPYGLFAFFFLQSTLLARKFAKVFTAVAVLTRHLETRVHERTRELDAERFKIEDNNRIMGNELLLAQHIQRQMLGSSPSSEAISAVYYPMTPAGGDFYDFVSFSDNNKIGIFICDVSGHGVSAVFITLLLKSLLVQYSESGENPSAVLSRMNEALVSLAGGPFCTAFYGIFDKTKRTLLYANAGHEQPFIIEKGKRRTLSGKRCAPLGVMDSRELALKGKGYVSECELLPEHSSLFLCTDGLPDARPVNGGDIFFAEAGLDDALSFFSGGSCRDLTDGVMKRLLEFRGSSSLDDDVSLICLSVV